MNPKQRAAEAALSYVRSGTSIGLGTGSTADYFLVALAAALKTGRLSDVRGVPSSEQTQRRARGLGIPLIDLADATGPLDVTVDGADEVADNLDLIKGLGGALLREKIVAQNSARLVIIADAGKRVARLGTKAVVPVEVVQFAHEAQVRFLRTLGCEPALRTRPDGSKFVTDNGNVVYDCRFPGAGIPDPRELDNVLNRRAGIVGSGLFLGMAEVAVIGGDSDVEVLKRS
jgi:ribose 5-phosphate isomerase A